MAMYEGSGSGVVFNHAAGLIAVPTENYRVQFYSLFDDREISEVSIFGVVYGMHVNQFSDRFPISVYALSYFSF